MVATARHKTTTRIGRMTGTWARARGTSSPIRTQKEPPEGGGPGRPKWEEKAARARSIAEHVADPAAITVSMEIAAYYELLASYARADEALPPRED
jgi:hypothetical protein